MRRAVDNARAKLDTLTERSAMLECFFEQARTLFNVSVLLLVKGDNAQGHFVAGVEAPDALVARIVLPLGEPSVLSRARELRRPHVAVAMMTDTDQRLFGTLGRTMTAPLVCPLVVRDRVVAIFLGEGPADRLNRAATETGRTTMDLAREEMLLWTESVREALERLILRKKGASIASVPPPRFSSAPPPAALGSPAINVAIAAPPAVPRFEFLSQPPPPPDPREAAPTKERGSTALFLLALAGLVGAGVVIWKLRKSDPEAGDRIVVAGTALTGWPTAVEPASGIEAARGAAGLGDGAKLASIRADVSAGKIDVTRRADGSEGVALWYVFVTDEAESEMRVDGDGFHAPRKGPRERCGTGPCRLPLPDPKCSFAQIWDAAKAVGLEDGQRARVTYENASRARGDEPRPFWSIAVDGRGQMRVDPATCKALPRERLRPPAVPITAVPGGPKRVEATEAIALARKQSALQDDAVLVEIDARGVTKGGRIDLEAPDSSITYTFSDPPAVPVSERHWRQVEIRATGMQVTASDEQQGPLATRFDVSVAPPRCTVASAHAYLALAGGTEGAARITYDADSSHQGRWTLEVPGTGTRRNISDLECDAWATLKRE
jgi:hypothetical protein